MLLRSFALMLTLFVGHAQAEEMNIADLPASKPADTRPKLAYGQMIKYGEKVVFAPCRDPSLVQVEDVSADGEVIRGLNQVGLAAGRKLYVELIGFVEAGVLKVSRLNLAQAEGRCQVPGGSDEAWRASGNEPGWIFAAGGEWVQLKRHGQPEIALPYRPFPPKDGVATYNAAQDGQQISLRFEQKLCRDTMADTVFGWTASVTVNGETLRGCAWQR